MCQKETPMRQSRENSTVPNIVSVYSDSEVRNIEKLFFTLYIYIYYVAKSLNYS